MGVGRRESPDARVLAGLVPGSTFTIETPNGTAIAMVLGTVPTPAATNRVDAAGAEPRNSVGTVLAELRDQLPRH